MTTTRRSLVVFAMTAPLFFAGCSKAKVSGTTEEGAELKASGDSLPKDWPKGLAAPEGATVTSVISEDDVVSASGTSAEDPIALGKKFADSLKADGWTQTNRSSDENSMVVMDWEKGGARAEVSTMTGSEGATFTLIHNPG